MLLLLILRRATLARGLSHQSPNHLEQTRRPVYISFTLLFFTGPFSPDDGDPRFRAAAATDPSNSSSPCALSDLSPPTKKKREGNEEEGGDFPQGRGRKNGLWGGRRLGPREIREGENGFHAHINSGLGVGGREGRRGDALCFVGFFPPPGLRGFRSSFAALFSKWVRGGDDHLGGLKGGQGGVKSFERT